MGTVHQTSRTAARALVRFCIFLLLPTTLAAGCGGEEEDLSSSRTKKQVTYHDSWARPDCRQAESARPDLLHPQTVVPDWSSPRRVRQPVNTPCPEDAIAVSSDGSLLYFMFTQDLLERLSPREILTWPSATYVAEHAGGPGRFGLPVTFDLSKGAQYALSLDGAPSFTPKGTMVFFHSNRAGNLGALDGRPDPLDIYLSNIVDGVPTRGRNLGAPVNSPWLDGEPAIHPDGRTLYFTSNRPGGEGGGDLWYSVWRDSSWSEAVNLGAPINSSRDDNQPSFSADGETMYFVSDRGLFPGNPAIYRAHWDGSRYVDPEEVIRGKVGEPSVTADGRFLYFIHILSDLGGNYDTDIWYVERKP